jgi:hypothetical protein
MNYVPSRRSFLLFSMASSVAFLTKLPPAFADQAEIEWGWRYCGSCGVLFRSSRGQGTCPNNPEGHAAAGFIFGIKYTGSCVDDTPKYQSKWRGCSNCMTIFYNGKATKVCPAGGSHSRDEGKCFYLPINRLHAEALNPENKFSQGGWRFCGRCAGLFFDGYLDNKGVCPAGGAHAALGDMFVLAHR